MGSFIMDTRIKNGHLKLKDVPFNDDTDVKVIVIPKVNLEKMSFRESQNAAKSIKGNLSDDIVAERDHK